MIVVFQAITKRVQRIKKRGLYVTLKILRDRIKSFYTFVWLRVLLLLGRTEYTMPQLSARYPAMRDRKEMFGHLIMNSPRFLPSLLDQLIVPDVIERADQLYFEQFSTFGSELKTYKNIPWHTDICLENERPTSNALFPSRKYSGYIRIKNTLSKDIGADIKVPWELGKMAHGTLLANAFRLSGRQIYAQLFFELFSSWWVQNQCMRGVNWRCPMYVGLRAINMVACFYQFFTTAAVIPPNFWDRYICSLFDHLNYLENHWERYDYKTNNHYLADLVGYYSLLFFFRHIEIMYEKSRWCYQEICNELRKQIHPDGTSYEGSTAYHRFITELCYLAYQITLELGFEAEEFRIILEKMTEFQRWMKPDYGDLIQIGDNDSGKIFDNFLQFPSRQRSQEYNQIQVKEWPYFGVSAYLSNRWHITLRHQTFQERQPAGHFHVDAASITIAYNGYPFIIDPGSYVYTASAAWRNEFRSLSAHSTFWIEGNEPIPLTENLFALELPPAPVQEGSSSISDKEITLTTQHELYKPIIGMCAQRTVKVKTDETMCSITDTWHTTHDQKNLNLISSHALVLHPDISISKKNDQILLQHPHAGTLSFTSTLPYALESAWYSPSYHVKVKTNRLIIRTALIPEQDVTMNLEPV